MRKRKKAQVTFFVTFLIFAVTLIVIAGVLIPFGIRFNIDMYRAGEYVLNNSQSTIDSIQDPAMRTAIGLAVTEAKAATTTNIDMNTDLFQWSWVIVLAMTALVMFLYTRQRVEYGGGVA